MDAGAVVPPAVSLVAGWLAWTLTEYTAHRWILHPVGRGRTAMILSAEHRLHHRDPLLTRPLLRLGGHLAVWAVALGSVYSVAATTTGRGPSAVVLALAGGWALGYSIYELGHWRTHHRRSLLRWREGLRYHHLVHHLDRAGVNYGVTVDWWDRVFRTRDTPDSITVRPTRAPLWLIESSGPDGVPDPTRSPIRYRRPRRDRVRTPPR